MTRTAVGRSRNMGWVVGAALFVAGSASAVNCGGPQRPRPTPPIADAGLSDAGPDAAPAEASAPLTLFEKLGGKEGLSRIVDSFLANMLGDKRISKHFAKVSKDAERKERLRSHLLEQLCAETGGGCSYSGRDLKTVHKDLRLADKEWNAFVEDLAVSLAEHKIGDAEQSELLSILARMKGDVVPDKHR